MRISIFLSGVKNRRVSKKIENFFREELYTYNPLTLSFERKQCPQLLPQLLHPFA